MDLLQLNVKLRRTEIDALYLLTEKHGDGTREVLVTCEAKSANEDITDSQVIGQARAAFGLRNATQDIVVPIAIKCVSPDSVYVIEFASFERDTAEDTELVKESDSLHRIVPPVPGICV